ncbi:MAG: BspA family leucine-rich repeat surface protein [Treponema sp.]|nr:BspA family leucine-rich repeat surface protein [Treponema sp.]
MKAKLCLKNLFIVSTLILIAFAASSCTVNADPPVYYSITAAEEIENGTVSVDKTSATSGETVKITATADDTYELSALSVTDENGNKIPVTDGSFTMPKGNVVVSATFASIFHNICIAQDIENGTVSVDKESAAQGETITVTAEPDEGYLLNSIHVIDSNGNEITVTENTFTMPKAHVTVSATFGYEIKIAETIENGSVSTVKNFVMAGESVQIETVPLEGYELKSLTVTDAEGNEIAVTEKTFTMPESDVSISAEFTAIIYSVNTSFNSDRGSVSLDKTSAIIGETVSISITPAKEYVLDSISVTDSEGNAVAVTENSFTMPASSVTVSATFLLFRLKIGREINSILLELGAKTTATQFLPSENPPSESDTAYTISTDESEIPVYVWLTGETINYYAPTKQLIPLNPDSSKLFYYCSNLRTIDFSGFDTSSVTNMRSMFYECSGLTSLDLSGFDTSSVTDMCLMFSGCYRLTSLDLSSFDTSSVTNMSSMFFYCAFLTSLDLSGFDTSNVTNMSYMFSWFGSLSNLSGFGSLTSLDLSGFDTSNVTNMSSMFSYCGLTSLDLSNFDTSSVTDMSSMFENCSSRTLDLSNFDTSSVTDMESMFENCYSLTLDLSNFDTSSVTDMESMFNSCYNLRTIYVSSAFNTNSVTSSLDMFNKCTSLKGGEGTAYDSDKTDKTYARIDGGTSAPGYFTEKK